MTRPCRRGCPHRCSTVNEGLTSRRHPSRKSSSRKDTKDAKGILSFAFFASLRDPKGVNSPGVLCLSPGTTSLAYYPFKALKQCDFGRHCLKVIQRSYHFQPFPATGSPAKPTARLSAVPLAQSLKCRPQV